MDIHVDMGSVDTEYGFHLYVYTNKTKKLVTKVYVII